ncbi:MULTISPECIES: histidine phosphatase family protein [unclassified Isoptericola]|uniref:SixA phosphatase family protein n=1 Tax=unclassified Isoptericola TaxID=2623355 RepID=UPI0027129C84|nr:MULTISPECIES: histidine phosphatase family protein [unclassified Isoptericola]MDO8149534.1 histidine phosphatase family protein [Isoptericola sp. b515]MDO8152468.1 histidine phosphatase family protein [Isoptericola sp. b408]
MNVSSTHTPDVPREGRRLVLLRHAKAEPGSDPVPDADRPLALRGRKQAGRVGSALTAAHLVPDLALVSSALRTRQTWELAAAHLPSRESITVDVRDELYAASVKDVLELVRGAADDVTTVLVVGHEPTMAATAAYLAAPGSDDAALAQVRVGVPTATYSVLHAEDLPWSRWGKNSATLVRVGRPS